MSCRKCSSPDWEERAEHARAADWLGGQCLANLLSDPLPRVVADALCSVELSDDVLSEALTAAVWSVIASKSYRLLNANSTTRNGLLRVACQHQMDGMDAKLAAATAVKFGEDAALLLLASPDVEVRIAVAANCMSHNAADAASFDAEPSVRIAAAGNPLLLKRRLKKMLKDQDPLVRMAVVDGLVSRKPAWKRSEALRRLYRHT